MLASRDKMFADGPEDIDSDVKVWDDFEVALSEREMAYDAAVRIKTPQNTQRHDSIMDMVFENDDEYDLCYFRSVAAGEPYTSSAVTVPPLQEPRTPRGEDLILFVDSPY